MKRIVVYLCLLGFVIFCYAAFIEPRFIRITEYRLESKKWPYETPLRIALVADTHAIWPWMPISLIDTIVKKTNALNPDLTLMLGDYVATHPFGWQTPPQHGLAPYTNLRAPCGVFAVLGNHDLHGTGSEGWPEALRSLTSVKTLENSSQRINCQGQSFWVAGLEDLWWQNADVEATLAQVTDDAPIFLMMHNPDSFIDVPPHVALSFAGHTHGGQIHLPFLGAVERVIPSKFGLRFHYGHIKEDNRDLIVSGGLGSTGIPLRFLNRPEIVLVTISSAP